MDVLTDHLAEARSAHQRRDWRASYAGFVRVDAVGPMTLDDLDAYATAAWRLGHGSEAVRLAERAYHQLARTDPAAAAQKAADLGLAWLARGHGAVARNWAHQARVLLVGVPTGSAHGYLAYLDAVIAVAADDSGALAEAANGLRDIVIRTGDPAVGVLARAVDGVSALMAAAPADGYRLLDEALLPTVDERVPLEWAGDVYGTVLRLGARLVDRDRQLAWVESMERWCQVREPVTYRAVCTLHRWRIEAAGNWTHDVGAVAELARVVADVDASAAELARELLGDVAR